VREGQEGSDSALVLGSCPRCNLICIRMKQIQYAGLRTRLFTWGHGSYLVLSPRPPAHRSGWAMG
jgi:hypothetical protein